MSAPAGLELDDPALENVSREIEHIEQGKRRGTNLVQPAVQYLFYGPGRFAQFGQSDHAAAAFQGMEAAAQGDQRILSARRGMDDRQMLVDGGQNFIGLLEENAQ